MAKRRLPPKLTDSPARIRSRRWESEWARLPREEVWPRGQPGAGPWGSLDEARSVPTMVVVGGFGLLLLGIFLMFWPLVAVGLAGVVIGAIAGVVTVVRRKGHRTTLLWGGIGSKPIETEEPERTETAREPLRESVREGEAGE